MFFFQMNACILSNSMKKKEKESSDIGFYTQCGTGLGMEEKKKRIHTLVFMHNVAEHREPTI